MSTISSSFQDHIDAGKASNSCPLVLKETNLHNEQYNKSPQEQVLNQIPESTCPAENDMFSLKLTQISSQNNADYGSDNCQAKKEKRCSPQKTP